MRQTIVAAKVPSGATTWPTSVQDMKEYQAKMEFKPLTKDGTDGTPGAEK